MARLLIASRSMALALRLADVHAIIEHSPDALDRLQPGPDVDAVVLDVGDPRLAVSTVERLRNAGTLTPVLLVSGYQPEWNEVDRLGLSRVQVVPLPITRVALLEGIGFLTGQIVDLASIPATPPAVPAAEVAEVAHEDVAPAAAAPEPQAPEELADEPAAPSRPAGPWSQGPVSQPMPLVPDGEGWGPAPHEPASIGAPGSTLPPPTPTGNIPIVPDPGGEPVQPAAARRRPLLGGLRGRGRRDVPEVGPVTPGSLTVAPPPAVPVPAHPVAPAPATPAPAPVARVPAASPPAGSPPAGLPSFPALDPALAGPPPAPSTAPARPPVTPATGATPFPHPLGTPHQPPPPAPPPEAPAPEPGAPPAEPAHDAAFDDLVLAQRKQQEELPLSSALEQRLDADAAAAATTLQTPTGSIHIVPRTADLVRMLLERRQELYGVGDTAQVLADDVVERADADAAAVLVPDEGGWRVSGGVGLRPLERRLVLEESHWMIAEIASTGRAVLIEDTDIIRTQLAGAPLASWRHLLCVPVPEVRAAVVLARGSEAGPFTDADLGAVVPTVREAAALLFQAIETRRLARELGALRETDADGRRRSY